MLNVTCTKNIKTERNRIAFILLLEINILVNSKTAGDERKRALFIKQPTLVMTTYDIIIAQMCFLKVGGNLLLYKLCILLHVTLYV